MFKVTPPPPGVGKATAQISWIQEPILSILIRLPAKPGKWPTVDDEGSCLTAPLLRLTFIDGILQVKRDPNIAEDAASALRLLL